jgi:hypothetical protein
LVTAISIALVSILGGIFGVSPSAVEGHGKVETKTIDWGLSIGYPEEEVLVVCRAVDTIVATVLDLDRGRIVLAG